MTEGDDWRARKKAATKHAIQEHALRLFVEKGYDATTVEEIAAAAGVSHMTFFRYFPRKEEVVEYDEYDPLLGDLVAARPADEPPHSAHARQSASSTGVTTSSRTSSGSRQASRSFRTIGARRASGFFASSLTRSVLVPRGTEASGH